MHSGDGGVFKFNWIFVRINLTQWKRTKWFELESTENATLIKLTKLTSPPFSIHCSRYVSKSTLQAQFISKGDKFFKNMLKKTLIMNGMGKSIYSGINWLLNPELSSPRKFKLTPKHLIRFEYINKRENKRRNSWTHIQIERPDEPMPSMQNIVNVSLTNRYENKLSKHASHAAGGKSDTNEMGERRLEAAWSGFLVLLFIFMFCRHESWRNALTFEMSTSPSSNVKRNLLYPRIRCPFHELCGYICFQ